MLCQRCKINILIKYYMVIIFLILTDSVYGEFSVCDSVRMKSISNTTSSALLPLNKGQLLDERDIFTMSLDELMKLSVAVDVASLFVEDELIVGATVSSTTSEEWRQNGARKLNEALDGEMNMVNFRNIGGTTILSIRGYTSSSSMRGISWLVDGVPINTLTYGTAGFTVPDWSLNTLDKIEIVKGPGSALYGSDAFHGVISLKSFESEKDMATAEIAGAWPEYFDAGLKASRGLSDHVRFDASFGVGHQGDLDIDYEYEDKTGSPERYGLGPKDGTGSRDWSQWQY